MTIGVKTLLRRSCPRCHRSGTVYLVQENQSASFDIVWDGPPRSLDFEEHDEDWGVTLEDLLNSDFGCGYDSPEAIKETEHLKVVPFVPRET